MRRPNEKNVIGKLRAVAGITAKQLSELTDGKVSQSLIEKIESKSKGSKRALTKEIARCISDETGVEEEWLLSGDASMPIMTREGYPYEAHSLNKYRIQLSTPQGYHDPANLLWKRYIKARQLAKRVIGSRKKWEKSQSILMVKASRDYDLAVETETQKLIKSIPYPKLKRDSTAEAAIRRQIATSGGLFLSELAALLIAAFRNPKRNLMIRKIREFNIQLGEEFQLKDAIIDRKGMERINKIHQWMSEGLKKELASL